MHRPQEGAPGFIVKDDDDGCVWKRLAPFAILTPGQQYLAFVLENRPHLTKIFHKQAEYESRSVAISKYFFVCCNFPFM